LNFTFFTILPIAAYPATLAQLVEQRFCKAKVPSSSLGGGSLTLFVNN
jgi:hypothetical protein